MEYIETPIGYLKKILNDKGDFLQEYKRINEPARLELKEWAKEEMTVKGINFKEPLPRPEITVPFLIKS